MLLAGLAIHGALADITLQDGSGGNTFQVTGSLGPNIAITGHSADLLIGPNATSSWEINSANGGKLNGNLSFSGIGNLRGGTGSDEFFFKQGGTVSGNLDGGPGIDTLRYAPHVLNGTETINLPAGIAPKISGSALNLESYSIVPALVVSNPGSQASPATFAITPLQILTTGGLGGATFSATGLPSGLTINSQTGIISGTIAANQASANPYHVAVMASDGDETVTANFDWTVFASIYVVNPGNQSSPEAAPVSLPIQVLNPFGHTITYSATGLPSALGIDPSTGVISGTEGYYYFYYGPNLNFSVQVTATDTTNSTSSSTNFQWRPLPAFEANSPADQLSQAGQSVYVGLGLNYFGRSFHYTAAGLPAGLTIDSFGQITGTLGDTADTASPYHVTFTATDLSTNYIYTRNFQWTVVPAIILSNPGHQTTPQGAIVDLANPVLREFGTPITFSADNLPIGLTIDSATGHIHGTIQAQTSVPNDFNVVIHATDGVHTGELSFTWTVNPQSPNIVQLADPIHGGVVTLASPAGTTLTASLNYPSYYDSTNSLDFPLGQLQFQIDGVAHGGSTQLTITPPVGHNWTDYYVYGPTPADASYRWFNFLYQHQTDDDDATNTGAEFLPSGQVVLHLVDGGRGDIDSTVNGAISQNFGGGSAVPLLSAHITGAPATWPAGTPVTLESQIGGAAAPGATIDWQVYTYDADFNYIQIAQGNQASISLTLPSSPFNQYYVYLTVTSQDGLVLAYDLYTIQGIENAPTDPTPGLAQFGVAGVPGDISTGQSFSGDLTAQDASGNFLAGFSGPASIQITDNHSNPLATLSGVFNGGHFAIPTQVLVNAGSTSVIDTLTITSGGISMQLPIVVHPVSRFAAIVQDPIIAGIGHPFDFTVQAEDDRGVFNSGYSGFVHLTYTDAGGTHDVGSGYHAATNGIVTFTNIVLPALGTYSLQASSADGLVVGNFSVTVPLVTHFGISGPTFVRQGTPFEISTISQDANQHSVLNYTGMVVLNLDGTIYAPEVITAGDSGAHVFPNLTSYAPGSHTLTLSDGIVSSSFTFQVLAPPSVGDLNLDGRVSVADISGLMMALSDLRHYQSMYGLLPDEVTTIVDVNGDGHLNGSDIQALICLVANAQSGEDDSDSQANSTSSHSVAASLTVPISIGNQPVAAVSTAILEHPLAVAAAEPVSMPTMIGKEEPGISVIKSEKPGSAVALSDLNESAPPDRNNETHWSVESNVAAGTLSRFAVYDVVDHLISKSIIEKDLPSSGIRLQIPLNLADDFFEVFKREQSFNYEDDLCTLHAIQLIYQCDK